MIVFDTLFAILIIYLFIYCCYQLFFFIKARDIEKYFESQEKARSIILHNKNLCVIIYATPKDKNLDQLLSVLNAQTYSKEFYEVHVIYQKDENDNSIMRDFSCGARIHNIQNPDYFSKDKAVNLFIQKMIPESKFDAYVFLGANRTVGEKYLENINKSILPSSVVVGSNITINEKNQFAKKVKNSIVSAYLKYVNRTYKLVRSMFHLPFFIDGDNLVITSDIIEKMGYVGLEDKDSELEFSLDLASNNITSVYSPYVITAIDIRNYDFSSPSLRNKFSLFVHYFPLLFFKANVFKEFILFLLKPNSLIVLLGFISLLMLSIYFPSHVALKAVVLLGIFLFVNFVISVYNSKMRIQDVLWLFLYPICLVWQKLKIFINGLTLQSIMHSEVEEENIKSATITTVVNNGKENFSAKLDLVSEYGMKKVVYREGNRFIETDSFLRMYDALEDVAYKLKSRGLILKTCQNCQHFKLTNDGTLDCLSGVCNISQSEIRIWNGCQYFNLHPDKKENS